MYLTHIKIQIQIYSIRVDSIRGDDWTKGSFYRVILLYRPVALSSLLHNAPQLSVPYKIVLAMQLVLQ